MKKLKEAMSRNESKFYAINFIDPRIVFFKKENFNSTCNENAYSEIKGTPMQIWSSANIFVFIWKWYVENFTLRHLFVFAFNAKSFAITFLVFFFFFSFSSLFLDGLPKTFSQRFMISHQESMWPGSDSFLGHTKRSFRKNCSSSRGACGAWWHLGAVAGVHGVRGLGGKPLATASFCFSRFFC